MNLHWCGFFSLCIFGMKAAQDRRKPNDIVECADDDPVDAEQPDTRCKVSCDYLVTLTADGKSTGDGFCKVWGSRPQKNLANKYCYVDGQYIPEPGPEGNVSAADPDFEFLFATETDSDCATWAELFDTQSLDEHGTSKWHANGKNRWSRRVEQNPTTEKYPTKYNCVYECCENWNKPMCDEYALFKYMKNAQKDGDIYAIQDTLPLCGEIWMGKFNSRVALTSDETGPSWKAEDRTREDSAFAKAIMNQCRPHCDWQFYWSEGCSWTETEPAIHDKSRSFMFQGIFKEPYNSATPDHACEYSRLDLLCDTFCRDDLWNGHPQTGNNNDQWQCHMHDHWLFEPTNLMFPSVPPPVLQPLIPAGNPWKTDFDAKRGADFQEALRTQLIPDGPPFVQEFLHLMTTTFRNYYQDYDTCVLNDGRTDSGGTLSEGYQKYVEWSCQSHKNIFENLLDNCPRIMSFQQRLLPHSEDGKWGFTEDESSGIKKCLCSCCNKFVGNPQNNERADPADPLDPIGVGTSSDVPQGSKCWNQNKWFDPPSESHKIRFSRFEVGAKDYVAFLFSRPHARYDSFKATFTELTDGDKTKSAVPGVGEGAPNKCEGFACLGWAGVKTVLGDAGITALQDLLADDFRTGAEYCTSPNDEESQLKRCSTDP